MTPRIDLIGIVTDDMAASLAFYRRLGLDIPTGVENDPHVEAGLPGGIRIAWDTAETVRGFLPAWQPARDGEGRVSLAFLCDDPAEVDRLHQDLTAAGARSEKEPWDAVWGQRYAVLRDPDGNTVDLFAPLS